MQGLTHRKSPPKATNWPEKKYLHIGQVVAANVVQKK